MRSRHRFPVSATALSWRVEVQAIGRRMFSGLARLSLLLLPTAMIGCVIEDPPPYSAPRQTPPRLDLFNADPNIDSAIVVPGPGSRVVFTVPVYSEDAGDPLIANLLLNYESGWNKEVVASDEVPPGTLDESAPERSIVIDWTLGQGIDVGCNRVTLLVTHLRNQNNDSTIPSPFKDDRDVAKAVWRVIVDPPGNDTPVVCP